MNREHDEKRSVRLRPRFMEALEEAGARRSGDEPDALFRELVERHAEPHRRYHTLEHVDDCLAWLDWSAGLTRRPAELALAFWFHDAIYELGADSEAQSAALARARLSELGLPLEVLSRVEAHILATKTHAAEHSDSKLFVDIDLSILGAPRARFDEFERQIRLEYSPVPDPLFRAGRLALLERFLAREAIFQHSSFREQLERRARDNLARRVEELR